MGAEEIGGFIVPFQAAEVPDTIIREAVPYQRPCATKHVMETVVENCYFTVCVNGVR